MTGPAPRIRWTRGLGGDSTHAWVGGMLLGGVLTRHDGVVIYHVEGVTTRWVTKGHGEVKTIAQGKASVRRAWRAWWAQLSEQPRWGV